MQKNCCDEHDDADDMAGVQLQVKLSARHTWQVPSVCCVLCEGGRMFEKKNTHTHNNY